MDVKQQAFSGQQLCRLLHVDRDGGQGLSSLSPYNPSNSLVVIFAGCTNSKRLSNSM